MPLQQSNRLFSAYDGHRMKPLSELACEPASDKSFLSQACLTVVHSFKTYGLLGRDLLANFISLPKRCRPGSTIPDADAFSRLQFPNDNSFNEDFVINNVSSDIAVTSEVLPAFRQLLPQNTLAQEVIG